MARISAQIPVMCGVAKLLPVAWMRAARPRHLEVHAAREELDRGAGCRRTRTGRRRRGCRPRSPTRTCHGQLSTGMLCAEATSSVRGSRRCRQVVQDRATCWSVERLMLITSKPCSTAHASPASRSMAVPLEPVFPRRARARWSATLRREPADDPRARRAVAADVVVRIVADLGRPVSSTSTVTRAGHRPDRGVIGLDPESTTHTRTPSARGSAPGPLPRHRIGPGGDRERWLGTPRPRSRPATPRRRYPLPRRASSPAI